MRRDATPPPSVRTFTLAWDALFLQLEVHSTYRLETAVTVTNPALPTREALA